MPSPISARSRISSLSMNGSLDVVLYADDTLIIGASEARLQEMLESVANVGGRYGMELHWSKFQLLEVNGQYRLKAPGGDVIHPRPFMSYLGCSIYADGKMKTELNGKLGAAWGAFNDLARVWKHTTLNISRKIHIFHAVIITRLLYGLSSAWLNARETRRLNGFYCRCLRVILKIPAAYFSRVSNAIVLQRAEQVELARQLLKQQLILYGRIVRTKDDDILRKVTFVPGTDIPATHQFVRRVGRPRNEWAVMLQKQFLQMGPSASNEIHDVCRWRAAVHKYCMAECLQ